MQCDYLADDLMVSKYKQAGDIANRTITHLIGFCVPGASVRRLCIEGDAFIMAEMAKVYKKEETKGIAFPTSVSVNNIVCHFSPAHTDPDYLLNDGDMVKIDLGAHVDGYAALVAHTIVVGASVTRKASGRQADALLAAYWSVQATLRLLRPPITNKDITETINQICDCFDCKPIQGMLSHRVKRFGIDMEKIIRMSLSEEQSSASSSSPAPSSSSSSSSSMQTSKRTSKVPEQTFTFEPREVFVIDVLISTGDGMGRASDDRANIFERGRGSYQLKLKSSRSFFSELTTQFSKFPCHIRNFQDESKARMGLAECIARGLVDPYCVFTERPGEMVAQFKYTVLVAANGVNLIGGLPLDFKAVLNKRDMLSAPLKELLARPLVKGKNNPLKEDTIDLARRPPKGSNC